jgi:hypothetical protein
MNEKRKYIRIPGDRINVKIKKYTGDTDFHFQKINNISAGGLLLHHTDEPKMNDYFLLNIDTLVGGNKRQIKCMARVERVDKRENGFDIALKFEWVSKEDIEYLNSMIEKMS